jgi:hypothetical protein
MNLFALGAGLIALICGGILIYIFGLGPLAYIISAAVHRIEGRNYLKALGVAGLSIIANALVHFILSRFMHGFGLWLVSLLINAAIAVLFVLLFYHVAIGKAITVWLLAFAISLGIGLVIGLFGLIIAGTTIFRTIQQLIQQYSFVLSLV